MRRILYYLLALVACAPSLHAQIRVGLSLKRHLYMAYEPIVATVSVTNLAGRDLPLADDNGHPWFGFTVLRADGMPVPAVDSNYKLSPLTIPAGATVKRTVNLNTLYPVHDYGPYKARAVIYFGLVDKFFESNVLNFEISEGKTIWQQVVGVPDGQPEAGSMRKISLLKFRQLESNVLYVRVEDPDKGMVYCTSALGRLLDNMEPEMQVDIFNRLHVLQIVGSKTYLHSEIGTNGAIAGRQTYVSESTRPYLSKDPTGEVSVKGGSVLDPKTAASGGIPTAPGKIVPKLSDRPVELPKD